MPSPKHSKHSPTILFESGHFKDDYSRENVRKYMCFALLTAINSILNKTYKKFDYMDYYLIKENEFTVNLCV